MGPIPPDITSPRCFLYLYIPSYTPTLSAPVESRRLSPRALDKPSMILLVAQPDKRILEAWKEIQIVKDVNIRVTALIPTAVLEQLRDHRFRPFRVMGRSKGNLSTLRSSCAKVCRKIGKWPYNRLYYDYFNQIRATLLIQSSSYGKFK